MTSRLRLPRNEEYAAGIIESAPDLDLYVKIGASGASDVRESPNWLTYVQNCARADIHLQMIQRYSRVSHSQDRTATEVSEHATPLTGAEHGLSPTEVRSNKVHSFMRT